LQQMLLNQELVTPVLIALKSDKMPENSSFQCH